MPSPSIPAPRHSGSYNVSELSLLWLPLLTLGIPPASDGAPKTLDPSLSPVAHSSPPTPPPPVHGISGIPCQPYLPYLSAFWPSRRGWWGRQNTSVASLIEVMPQGCRRHRSMPSGQWSPYQVPLCPPLMVSPPSPSGIWRLSRPRWRFWGTGVWSAWHLGIPWTGVWSTRRPRVPWSVGPSTPEEVELSWDQPRTLKEVLRPSPGLRCRRPSGDPGRPQRGPSPSWTYCWIILASREVVPVPYPARNPWSVSWK